MLAQGIVMAAEFALFMFLIINAMNGNTPRSP